MAAIQDITEYGFVGARYDVYDPDSDITDTRRGTLYSRDLSIKTLSPIVGVRWPGVARLTFQYDWVTDTYARTRAACPTTWRTMRGPCAHRGGSDAKLVSLLLALV